MQFVTHGTPQSFLVAPYMAALWRTVAAAGRAKKSPSVCLRCDAIIIGANGDQRPLVWGTGVRRLVKVELCPKVRLQRLCPFPSSQAPNGIKS